MFTVTLLHSDNSVHRSLQNGDMLTADKTTKQKTFKFCLQVGPLFGVDLFGVNTVQQLKKSLKKSCKRTVP